MRRSFVQLTGPCLAVAWLFAPVNAHAQSLTVTLLPAAVTFTLTNGSSTNAGSLPLVVTTVWTLLPPGQTISLYGYFSSSTAALAHVSPANSVDIPSSRVQVSINGSAGAPFDQTVPFGAANSGRLFVTQAITLATLSGIRTDTLSLNINLNGYALPADAYAGTLRVRARVSP